MPAVKMPRTTRTSWKTEGRKLRPRTVASASSGMTPAQVRSEVAALKRSDDIKQLARDLRKVILIGKVVNMGRVVSVTWTTGRARKFADGTFVKLASVGGRR